MVLALRNCNLAILELDNNGVTGLCANSRPGKPPIDSDHHPLLAVSHKFLQVSNQGAAYEQCNYSEIVVREQPELEV
ncbi:hypothetical protein M5K25_003555 [Dendrobium thyrsiflorum]|uniref:Uncharacterized protein n=1 Tax=Dendrobium thyrsiflorum TaxID=117978 RepID=A0ABD0VRU4_DENTH